MELKNLQKHIRTLATLEETNSPVISYYLNRESDELSNRLKLTEQGRVLRQSLWGRAKHDFEEAMNQIETYVDTELLPDAKGVAIFARTGEGPFFLPLQFRVPLPNWLAVTANPNIYHLIELKDTYHRYVVMISTEESARILEVTLGSVTEELWRERPELRERVGREWTKEHYQNHRRERTNQFIKEKIKILERLMAAGGHTHLILAGNPQMTARIRKAFPRHLEEKLIDTVVAGSKGMVSTVVPRVSEVRYARTMDVIGASASASRWKRSSWPKVTLCSLARTRIGSSARALVSLVSPRLQMAMPHRTRRTAENAT